MLVLLPQETFWQVWWGWGACCLASRILLPNHRSNLAPWQKGSQPLTTREFPLKGNFEVPKN